MAFYHCSIAQFHTSTDPEWTREETDYLFNLIREYDSRFYIINDRYDFPGGPLRSMEVKIWTLAFHVLRLCHRI